MSSQRRRIVRKKIHWGRILVLLLFLAAVSGGAWGSYKAYQWVRWHQEPTVSAERRVDTWTGQVNVLLLGYGPPVKELEDLDASALLSFGPDGKITLLPLPREMLLPQKDGKAVTMQQLEQKQGRLAVREAIALWLGQPVHFYMAIPAESWMQLIDIAGGLTLYVEQEMHYEDPYGGTVIHLSRGVQRLNGKESLDYLRYRSDELGDVHRLQRQQRVAQAMVKTFYSSASLGRSGYFNAWYEQRVETDLTLRDAAILIWRGRKMTGSSFHTALLPGEFKRSGSGLQWATSPEKLRVWLNELFPKEE